VDGIEELGREPGLEGFEAWDRRRQAPARHEDRGAFVAVWADATISISNAAYELLGSPDTVQLLFDPRLRRIGIRPVERDAARAVYSSYFFLGGGGQNLIPARRFCEHYGVPVGETRRYTPKEVVDGVLVVDL